jgi:hypothetical protein
MTQTDSTLLHAKLNLETAPITWKELERFFASGAVYFVAANLDMVDVAVQISQDNSAAVKAWLDAGELSAVSDAQALQWLEANATLWSVVVKPWILVQEMAANLAQPN